MVNVPPAIIENAPLHKRAWIRKLVGVTLVLVVLYGGCKVFKRLTRGEAYDRIAKQQEASRAIIGDGLDDLFEAQLDHESTTVQLDAVLESNGVGSGYSVGECVTGLNAAFKDVLGYEVVDFSTSSFRDSGVKLTLSGKIAASGNGFSLPYSEKIYKGVVLTGEVKFLDKTFPVDIKPPSDIKFTHTTFGTPMLGQGPSDSDVEGGIMQGTCQELAYAILEEMTTWRRPAPPPKADPIADCQRGFHCRDSAEALEESDPEKSAKLYGMACQNHDDAACVRFAELELPHAKETGPRAANLRVTLEMACMNDQPGACGMAGVVTARSGTDGTPASAYERREALGFFARACDLGNTDACTGAAAMLKGTPFADAAPLLAGKSTAATKQFGTAFALRWGQWTQFDHGQATLWVTRPPAHLPEGAIVSPFRGDRIPKGIVPPRGVTEVYAIALSASGDRCQMCQPSGGGKTPFSFRSTSCVCAIAR